MVIQIFKLKGIENRYLIIVSRSVDRLVDQDLELQYTEFSLILQISDDSGLETSLPQPVSV